MKEREKYSSAKGKPSHTVKCGVNAVHLSKWRWGRDFTHLQQQKQNKFLISLLEVRRATITSKEQEYKLFKPKNPKVPFALYTFGELVPRHTSFCLLKKIPTCWRQSRKQTIHYEKKSILGATLDLGRLLNFEFPGRPTISNSIPFHCLHHLSHLPKIGLHWLCSPHAHSRPHRGHRSPSSPVPTARQVLCHEKDHSSLELGFVWLVHTPAPSQVLYLRYSPKCYLVFQKI